MAEPDYREVLEWLRTRPVEGVNVHTPLARSQPQYYGMMAPEAYWAGGPANVGAEAVPFGSLADPVSQLAMLAAPSVLRGGKALLDEVVQPYPMRPVMASERGGIALPGDASGAGGMTAPDVPVITTLEGLKKVVGSSSDKTPLYLRWSRGPQFDVGKVSRDYVAGGVHKGLSAVDINPAWATDDPWLARRIMEYRFLRMKDPKIDPWVYRGTQVGRDSDSYPLISHVTPVARIHDDVIKLLETLRQD